MKGNQKLASIKPKKILAHQKNEKDIDYKTFICLECNKEYLSQGLVDLEQDFCPLHINSDYCNGCNESFDNSKLKLDKIDNELYCNECYTEYCINCKDSVRVGSTYCSNECRTEFNQMF